MFRLPYQVSKERSGPSSQSLKRTLLLAGALLLLWAAVQLIPPQSSDPNISYSDESGTVVPNKNRTPHRSGSNYFVVLILLLGGGGAAIYLRKKRENLPRTSTSLQEMANLQFGPGQQLHLVSCGNDVLLLGVTSNQIALLKSYPADTFQQVENGKDHSRSNGEHITSPLNGTSPGFPRVLGSYLHKQYISEQAPVS